MLFGLAPALSLSQSNPARALADASRGASGRDTIWGRRVRIRQSLVWRCCSGGAGRCGAQSGAGLLVRSLSRSSGRCRLNPGPTECAVGFSLTGRRGPDSAALQMDGARCGTSFK